MISYCDMLETHRIYTKDEVLEIMFGPVRQGSNKWFLKFRADGELIFELKGTRDDITEKGFLLIDILDEANQER